MAAKVRAKQRHLASTAPSLLQFTSTRTAADKALKDAETATEAALQVIAGVPLPSPLPLPLPLLLPLPLSLSLPLPLLSTLGSADDQLYPACSCCCFAG